MTADGTDYELGSANSVGLYGYGNVSMMPGNPIDAGVLYRNSSVRFADIGDGLSNTLAVGERAHEICIGSSDPVASNSTWYAAIPKATRPAGMAMMPMMTEGPASLVLGHVGQPAMPPSPP